MQFSESFSVERRYFRSAPKAANSLYGNPTEIGPDGMDFYKRLAWHLKNEKDRFGWISSRFLYYTKLGRFLTINAGSYKIRFFPSAISLAKWLDPSYGYEDESLLRKILRPMDVLVDVGANIGTLTLTAASLVGQKGQVIAFEPSRRIYEYLCKNIKLNKFDNVTPINSAVGDKVGEVGFYDQRHDEMNRILPQSGHMIPMTTLDEHLRSVQGRIKLLKVDVEGYERYVFHGAPNTLARTEYIYFEVHEPNFQHWGYSTRDLLVFLRDAGFSLYRISEEGKETAVGTDFTSEKCINLLAKRVAMMGKSVSDQ
jgi:FkbM family methyltransferase